jgi:hypothetical protein
LELQARCAVVAVLNDLHCIAFIAYLPELSDIPLAEHVCVHKNGPALIATHPWHQESAEGEFCALEWMVGSVVDALKLRQSDLPNLYKLA